MRDIGLLQVWVDAKGTVGRPQHRYSLAPDAPALGLEPPTFPVLARMLVGVVARGGAALDDVLAAGRDQGEAEAAGVVATDPAACVAALVRLLARYGFDPEAVPDDEDADGGGATVGFARCPFRELAEAQPALVCGLHRGLVEGFVDATGAASVTDFGTLVDRHPCRVQISAPASVAS
jgi:predicted ArsR family transcriptional regulator